jgi:DNA-binding MarR family transcriptional regulator
MASLFDRLQSEIEARERVEGISPAKLPDLSHELSHIVYMIWRRGQMSLTEIVHELDMRQSEVKELLDALVDKGHLKVSELEGELRYKTHFARRRECEVPINIWEALSEKVE